jgi:hypothetical protein
VGLEQLDEGDLPHQNIPVGMGVGVMRAMIVECADGYRRRVIGGRRARKPAAESSPVLEPGASVCRAA